VVNPKSFYHKGHEGFHEGSLRLFGFLSYLKIIYCHQLYSFTGKHIVFIACIINQNSIGIPEQEKVISPVITLSLKVDETIPAFICPAVI
jgi:hypothetical protein